MRTRVACAALGAAVLSTALHAQSPSGPTFDVVSIRPSSPSPTAGGGFRTSPDGGFVGTGVTASLLISMAYPVSGRDIVGLPDWAQRDRYDLNATVAGDRTQPPTSEQRREMWRAVLAERFKFSGHMETREVPAFDLVLARNVPLRLLIIRAYDISDRQLLSAPDWVRSERFDINARFEVEPPAIEQSGAEAWRLALRSLLAERFKLTVRRESREFPMYALVMAREDRRPGRGLRPSPTDCSPEGIGARMAAAKQGQPRNIATCGTRVNAGRIQFGGYPLSVFAKNFKPYGRDVIDRTGLTGNWEFELTYTPDEPVIQRPGQDLPAVDPDGPTLLTALQEQLGLKLETTTATLDVLVIERVERPTED